MTLGIGLWGVLLQTKNILTSRTLDRNAQGQSSDTSLSCQHDQCTSPLEYK
jgi:hypothetical protein